MAQNDSPNGAKLSSYQRMADALLKAKGTTLVDFLTENRHLTYEHLTKTLYAKTDGSVDISFDTAKRWLIQFDLVEETA